MKTDTRLPYREISDDFLAPRDPVLGYIKVGGRSPTIRYTRAGKPWVGPIRLLDPARFEVTTREKRTKKVMGQGNAAGQEFTVDLGYVRDEDFHAFKSVGPKPNSLRIRLLYPTWRQNLISFLGAYGGGVWVCRGSGVEATDIKRGECACPCPRLIQFSGNYEGTRPNDGKKPLVCKPHGQLNVLLEDAGVFGGFWPFKTTSYGSISNLIKSLRMFEEMFGRIDGLPLELRVMAVTMQVPGGGTTVQPQVTLVLPASMDGARQIAKSAADESRKYLPAGGALDETKYLEAVVVEMEEEGKAYAEEFMPAEEVEAEEIKEPEGVVEGELRKQAEIQAMQRGAEATAEAAVLHKCEKCDGVLDSAGVCQWCKAGRQPPLEEDEREPGLGRVAPVDAHPPVTPEPPASAETARAPEEGNPNQEYKDEVEDDNDGPEGDRGAGQTDAGEPHRRERGGRDAEALPASRGDVDGDGGDDRTGDQIRGENPAVVDDSDRNRPEPKIDDYDFAMKVLLAAGWEEEAIQGRLEHHQKMGTLDELLDRLERGEPDAWAKVTALDLFEGEPEDGLES